MMGVGLLSGCIGESDSDGGGSDGGSGGSDLGGDDEPSDVDGDGVPDKDDDYPENPDYTTKVGEFSDRVEVEEDSWTYWEMEFNEPTEIGYEFIVRDGPDADLIMFEESEFSHYEEMERAEYLGSASSMNTSNADVERVSVPAGSYRLVIDNSNWGEAQPPTNLDDDVVTAELSFLALR